MLKWFGAGVGCTSAVAFGLYALHIEGDQPVAPSVASLELPLEKGDAIVAPIGSVAQVAPLSKATNPSLNGSAYQAKKPSAVRIVSPSRTNATSASGRTQSGARPKLADNGWTLRFVPTSSARLTADASSSQTTSAHTALARNIQRELKQAGCSSKINSHGYWDKTTRSAAVRFIRNRNSAIPTDRPDEALLSMLKNYHGTQCGAVQIVRPAKSRPARLKQPPRLVTRSSRSAITTGWSTRTSPVAQQQAGRVQRQPTFVSSSRITPSSGRTALQGVPPSYANIQRQNGSRVNNGRMALGARSSYSQPGTATVPSGTVPLAVSPGRTFGPTDTNQTEGYLAPRYDDERAAALRRAFLESKRNARKAKARKRRAARRRAYRRRRSRSWTQRVFDGHN